MMINMHKAQLILVTVFLASFIIQIGSFYLTYLFEAIYAEDLRELFTKFLAVYAVPLAIIIGGIFGQQKNQPRELRNVTFLIALALAIIWNMMLLWRSIAFTLAEQDSVKELIKYSDAVSSASMFLVAGALSYFFSKQE